jgi:hypothetical protein
MILKRTSKKFGRVLRMIAALLAAGAIIACWQHRQSHGSGYPDLPAPTGKIPAATNAGSANAVAASSVPSAAELSRRRALAASFQKHPFPVARESAGYQWTSADGKDAEVIRRLAHNDLEYRRMMDENSRILGRQLVYCNDTADAVVERSRLSGKPVQQLTLPGLNGLEVRFEITRTDLSPSGRQGAFAGHVAGRDDSTVTLAFKGGREAFTVISPSDGLFLQADPREPGELIVKSIDPATYVPGVCGIP